MEKKLKAFVVLLIGSILLIALPNCARYNPKPFSPHTYSHTKEKEGVEISKRTLTEYDCKEYFDRKLLARGYQPIQVCIKNNSDKTYILDSEKIELPLEPVKNVSNKLHRDIGWKATKYFIIGGPIWAALEGYSSYEVNKKIDNDLNARTINESDLIKIKPHGVVNKVMFVSTGNYSSNFDITLTEEKNHKEIKFEL